MNHNTPFLDRLSAHFHTNEAQLKGIFLPSEMPRVFRLRDLYNEILRNPLAPDVERVKWLKITYNLQRTQAYYDLADLRAITGAIKVDKEALRHEAILAIKQKMAEAKDGTEWARHMKNLISVSRLDKDDPEPLDLNKLYPRRTEPTTDVTVLGLPAPEPGLEEKLRQRYGKYKYEYEEAEYEDISPEADPLEAPLAIDKKREESLSNVNA